MLTRAYAHGTTSFYLASFESASFSECGPQVRLNLPLLYCRPNWIHTGLFSGLYQSGTSRLSCIVFFFALLLHRIQ